MDQKIRRKTNPTFKKTNNYLRGMQCIAQGDLQPAAAILLKEDQNSPSYEFALGNAALAMRRLGNYPKALKLATKALDAIEKRGRSLDPPSHVQFARTKAEAFSKIHPGEPLSLFNDAVQLADELAENHSSFEDDVQIEKAHTLVGWGGALLDKERWKPAIEVLESARDLYSDLKEYERNGLAEALTNLNIALHRHSDQIRQDLSARADFALQEAKDHAESRGDQDQLDRILIRAAQTQANWLRKAPLKVINSAAERAVEDNRWSIAHERYCIGADLSQELDREIAGVKLAHKAFRLEDKLDLNRNKAELRRTYSDLLRSLDRPPQERIPPLVKGAKLYYQLLRSSSRAADVPFHSSSLHDPLRKLSKTLLEAGRPAESLAAFEYGRTLTYLMDSDPSKLISRFDKAPFQKENSVDISEVKSLMRSLSSKEVAVTASILPREILAYVVYREGVSCIRSKLSKTERGRLSRDIRDMPHRLENGVGARSMNKQLHEFADLLKEKIGNRHIRALSPYANLHRVPWRALLHHAGVPWEQLPFVTTFNLLTEDTNWRVSVDSHGTALGHDDGTSFGYDLDQEARDFAQILNLDYHDATSSNILSVLQNSGIVLISCHGRESDGELLLSLRDGKYPTSKWCPHEVEAKLVVLSACESGVFSMAHGDHPVGAAPEIAARGADICLGTRWKVNARFAANFITHIGAGLAKKNTIGEAFALALRQCEKEGYDLWHDLACYEIFSAP